MVYRVGLGTDEAALATWTASIQSRGGFVTWINGERTAVFRRPGLPDVYERPPLSIRAGDTTTAAGEGVQKAAGQAVAIRDTVLGATGLSSGTVGLLAKVTGIPAPLLYTAGMLLAYGIIANSLGLPPLLGSRRTHW